MLKRRGNFYLCIKCSFDNIVLMAQFFVLNQNLMILQFYRKRLLQRKGIFWRLIFLYQKSKSYSSGSSLVLSAIYQNLFLSYFVINNNGLFTFHTESSLKAHSKV